MVDLEPTGRDDAMAITDVLSALGTCTIQLAPGIYHFNSPIILKHHGTVIRGHGELTQILKCHDEPAFFMRANDLVLDRFMMCNSVSSPGVGILSDAQIRGCVTNAVRFREFGIGIEVQQGITRWSCHRCVFNNSRVAGIRMRHIASPDTNNAQITECIFSEGSPTPIDKSCGILYASGGGLWISRCTFLGMDKGIWCSSVTPDNQPTIGTADLFVTSCSFELQRVRGIQFDAMDVKGFSVVHVNDSHFMCSESARGWKGIEANWPNLSVVQLSDNDFQLGSDGAKAIHIHKANAVRASSNLAVYSTAEIGDFLDVFDSRGNEKQVKFTDCELVRI